MNNLKLVMNTFSRFERAKGPPGRDDDLEMEEELTRRGRGSNMPRLMFSGGTYISGKFVRSLFHHCL